MTDRFRDLNNTWIYDQQSFCDSTVVFSNTICQVRRGNPFLEADSRSFNQSLDIIAAGGASKETDVTGSEAGVKRLIDSSLGGTDYFALGESSTANKLPIGIPRMAWDGGYTVLHALGLGSNSTYLNALKQSSQIGSRVWSIFWGRMWTDDNPLDGSIVFGGYDQRKIIGQNHTQALDFTSTGCWTGMKVNIADVLVNYRTGNDQSIFSANTVLPVCLVPQRQLLIEVPSAVYENYEIATNTTNIGSSFGLHWSAHLFDAGTE
jgi:Eukaryotic aspartyl protease